MSFLNAYEILEHVTDENLDDEPDDFFDEDMSEYISIDHNNYRTAIWDDISQINPDDLPC